MKNTSIKNTNNKHDMDSVESLDSRAGRNVQYHNEISAIGTALCEYVRSRTVSTVEPCNEYIV